MHLQQVNRDDESWGEDRSYGDIALAVDFEFLGTLILTSERLNLAEERPDFNKIFPKKSMDCFSNHDLL